MEMGQQTRGDGQRVSGVFFFFTRQGQGRMLCLGSWHLEDDVPHMVWLVENMLDAACLGLNMSKQVPYEAKFTLSTVICLFVLSVN